MVWCIPQGTVVHHTDPRHLLNCTEAPGGAEEREKKSEVCISPGQGAEASEGKAWERSHVSNKALNRAKPKALTESWVLVKTSLCPRQFPPSQKFLLLSQHLDLKGFVLFLF